MALILRKNTGNDPLTYEQLDGNFEYFTGSHAITGSLTVSGNIIGSLLGTASTASFVTLAQTASFVTLAQTASYVTTAQTASYVENAQTASFVTLAQTALLAQTASFVENAQTASYVENAQTASYVENAQTASYINPLEQDIQLTGSLIVDEGYIANFPTNSMNLTIPPGHNALLIGPIYNSASINVSIGSRLVIL
jgi:hypothetical protein